MLGDCGRTAAWRWQSRRNAEPLQMWKRRNGQVNHDGGPRVLRWVGLVKAVLECRAGGAGVVVLANNV